MNDTKSSYLISNEDLRQIDVDITFFQGSVFDNFATALTLNHLLKLT